MVVEGIVWVVIACKEKYKIWLEEWRHWSNTRKMKKRQKESHLGRKKEVKRGRTVVQASGIGVLVCQSNVATEMPEEKCKGSFRTVNRMAQDGSPSEDEGEKMRIWEEGEPHRRNENEQM